MEAGMALRRNCSTDVYPAPAPIIAARTQLIIILGLYDIAKNDTHLQAIMLGLADGKLKFTEDYP